MEGLLARLLINAAALWVADYLVDGIRGPDNVVNYLIVAAIFGLVNALIRPILSLLTCPLVMLTFGLFALVINAAMLLLTSVIARNFDIGFQVAGFIPALVGAVIISIVSLVLSVVVRD